MTVFVDTSALYALLDADDDAHAGARTTLSGLVDGREELVSTDYVLVEATALLQRRLGLPAVRALHERLAPLLVTVVADRAVYDAGVAALLATGRRGLSLVDLTSFAVMRRDGITTAFAFDAHFTAQGFAVIP